MNGPFDRIAKIIQATNIFFVDTDIFKLSKAITTVHLKQLQISGRNLAHDMCCYRRGLEGPRLTCARALKFLIILRMSS